MYVSDKNPQRFPKKIPPSGKVTGLQARSKAKRNQKAIIANLLIYQGLFRVPLNSVLKWSAITCY